MSGRIVFAVLLAVAISHPVVADDASSCQVVTYNIRYATTNDGEDFWGHRSDAVTQYLGQFDLFGLQEVTKPQLDTLKKGLPDFDSYGVGRDDGESGGEHAPIFYRKDRFESLDRGTFWLSQTPDAAGSKGWDAALPRTCTWMHLRDLKTGKTFVVGNTHFDHRGSQARTESGRLIASKIDELPEKMRVILLGDFNCKKDSEPYNAIVASVDDARTRSQKTPSGPDSTWNGFREIEPGQIIDHIFVRGVDVANLVVDDPKTNGGRFASDHLPVRAVVHFD